MNILIVDDDPFALHLLSQQLAQLGLHNVRTCDNAGAALALLSDDITAFDALFCDLNMPGMDGVELLRHLAQTEYGGGLVVVSGEDPRILDSVCRLARAHRLRVWGALHKPFDIDALQRLIEGAGRHVAPAAEPGQRKSYGADELRQAIAGGQMINHYQPKIDFTHARTAGVEALVRWQHPQDGLVYPDQFLATVEQSGLIDELAHAVLTRALADAHTLNGLGYPLRHAVNVSMRNLIALDFPDRVARAAESAGVPIAQLILEVTESQLMQDPQSLLDIVTRLRLKGIGLAIDDFGTGFSSLAQLRDMPFDELKLDPTFVLGANENGPLIAILRANLGMARQLGLRSVAEGIENRGDWDCLRALGCDLAQGYFIARPMPAHRLPDWLAAWELRRPAFAAKPPKESGGPDIASDPPP